MALRKQAKTLSKAQIQMVTRYLGGKRHSKRNIAMFLLSVRAGLRAKELSLVCWKHLVGSDGQLNDYLTLPNTASKGNSGRMVPLHSDLKKALLDLLEVQSKRRSFTLDQPLAQSQKGGSMDRQVVVNWFHNLYEELGLVGASSHSGRRTFCTNIAKKVGEAGCTIKDVQQLMGHSSVQTTMAYIDLNPEGQKQLVNLW